MDFRRVLIIAAIEIFFQFQLKADSPEFLTDSTSIYIGKGASICVGGNFNLDANTNFTNNGRLCFVSVEESDINLSLSEVGNGNFVFKGVSDSYLTTSGTFVDSLNIETEGGDVYLTGDLYVNNYLSLSKGLFRVSDNSSFWLLNSDSSAFDYPSGSSPSSYIVGPFIRHVNQTDTYYFPVGTESSYHPAYATDSTDSCYVRVEYDPEFADEWSSYSVSDEISINEVGGWKITSPDESEVKLLVGLSLYADNTLQEGSFAFVHASTDVLTSKEFDIDYDAVSTSEGFLEASESYSPGIYSYSDVSDSTSTEDDDSENNSSTQLDLVNTIIQNGTGTTTFQIDKLSNLSDVCLKVYNRWGSIVYINHSYQNNLDVSILYPGTYYYDLSYTDTNGEKVRRHEFLEVVREK